MKPRFRIRSAVVAAMAALILLGPGVVYAETDDSSVGVSTPGPSSTKPVWLQKLEDRFYLSPVVATGYRFQERILRTDEGKIIRDEGGNPLYEERSGRLLTLAAVHYSLKEYMTIFGVYGLEHTSPSNTLQAEVGQMVGLGVSYTDYIGGTIGVCVEIADGGGWQAFEYTENYLLVVGIVWQGLDLDLTGMMED